MSQKLPGLSTKTTESNLDLLIQQGMLAHRQGNFQDAAKAYEKALKKAPDILAALNLLADAQLNLGKNARALETARKALAIKPDMVSTWVVQGSAQRRMGDLETAITSLKKALELKPDHTDAMLMLAGTLRDAGQLDDSIDLYEDLISLAPTMAMAHYNLGNALVADRQYDEAIHAYRQAISLDPSYTPAHINLAGALHADDQIEEALEAIEAALVQAPHHRSAKINRGNILKSLVRLEEAEAQYRELLAEEKNDAEVMDLLGTSLQGQARLDEAISTYRAAIKLNPKMQIIRGDLSTALLANGQIREGWQHYDARFGKEAKLVFQRKVGKAKWTGENLAGKTILVWREQGIGDDIRFASCYPDLMARVARDGGRLIIETDPRLITLYARSFPGATVRAEGSLTEGEIIDYDIAAGSLPAIFRNEITDFPAENSFLRPNEARQAAYRAELDKRGPGLKVGLAWRSRDMAAGRQRFYTKLPDWAALFNRDDLHLVNLQYDNAKEEIAHANETLGANIHVVADLDLMNDLDGAAALTASLDLVISASTSVADMAGALGIPTYTYGAYRHPMCLGTDVFPWYPSMTWVSHRWNEDLQISVNNITNVALARAQQHT